MPTNKMAPVLVVDDEPQVRLLLESLLAEQGYFVLTASNGCEALNAMEDRLPGLVLLDLRMPVMGGWETLAAIRSRQWPVPVVFLSGGINAAVQAAAHGADGYLAKPFNFDVVVETVRGFLPLAEAETASRTRVAIIGFAEEQARRLEEIVQEASCTPLTAPMDSAPDTPATLRQFLDGQRVGVVLYNVCQPYPEHWAFFAALRAAERADGTGRRFVALTPDKRALQAEVGPTPALPLRGERGDRVTILQGLHELALV